MFRRVGPRPWVRRQSGGNMWRRRLEDRSRALRRWERQRGGSLREKAEESRGWGWGGGWVGGQGVEGWVILNQCTRGSPTMTLPRFRVPLFAGRMEAPMPARLT